MYFYDQNNPEKLWLHLHGLATNVYGQKIEFLRNFFSNRGTYSFFAMDMDYEKHTTTNTLNILRALIRGFSEEYKEIVLCGSSHGAYVALNYVRFQPLFNVKKLILLAPSYNTLTLILNTFGRGKLKDWLEGKTEITIVEEEREITFVKDWAKDVIEKDYEIIEGEDVKFPTEPPVEITIMHGVKDDIVPIKYSELFVSKVKVKKFLKVDDDHSLTESVKKYIEDLIS